MPKYTPQHVTTNLMTRPSPSAGSSPSLDKVLPSAHVDNTGSSIFHVAFLVRLQDLWFKPGNASVAYLGVNYSRGICSTPPLTRQVEG